MRSEFPPTLLAGHQRFRNTANGADGANAAGAAAARARWAELSTGQQPRAMVIGCCDSRVPPECVFDAAPGELFVLRTISGWVAPPAANAPDATGPDAGAALALEYAVRALGIRHVVVLGHSQCGGVRAARDPEAAGLQEPLTARWLGTLAPALEDLRGGDAADDAARQTRAEQRVVARSLENLRGFACAEEALRTGALALHGAWFEIGSAALHILDARTGDFAEAPSPASPATPTESTR